MKRLSDFIILAATIVMAMSCSGNKTTTGVVSDVTDSILTESVGAGFENESSKDEHTDAYCEVKATVDYPKGTDEVSVTIRYDLLKQMDVCMAQEDGKRLFALYESEKFDMENATKYYVENAFKQLRAQSEADHKERVKAMREYAESEGQKFEQPEINQYSKLLEIHKGTVTDNYCVYSVQLYCYYGGAHGMTFNSQHTYNRADGKRFDNFLKSGAVTALQPLMRNGLVEYFKEQDPNITQASLSDYLQIEGNVVPLPKEPLYPTTEGLVFSYGQYEIAAYAAGQPNFCVPYNKIKPYLTPEAIKLLGL